MSVKIMTGIKIGLVEVSPDWQPREHLDTDHTAELVAVARSGAELPPLDVVRLASGGFALVDGYHRHAAYLAAGVKVVSLRVLDSGDHSVAVWWSLAANRTHGLKRTRADKRRAVRLALSHPYAAEMSRADLAAHLGVSVDLIAEVRAEVGQPSPRVTATDRATEAAATLSPGESIRQAADRAGVSKSAVARALAARPETVPSGVKPQRGQQIAAGNEHLAFENEDAETVAFATIIPDATPWIEASREIASMSRRLRSTLPESRDAASCLEALRVAAHHAEHGAPVACSAHSGESCRWCGGRGWMSSADARTHAQAMRS